MPNVAGYERYCVFKDFLRDSVECEVGNENAMKLVARLKGYSKSELILAKFLARNIRNDRTVRALVYLY